MTLSSRLTQERLAELLELVDVQASYDTMPNNWCARSKREYLGQAKRLLPHLGEQEAPSCCTYCGKELAKDRDSYCMGHGKEEPSSAGRSAVPSPPAVSGPPDAQVTRVEVIDYRHGAPVVGRAFVAWGCAVELSRQDAGRTLKIFVMDRAAQAPQEESR